MKTQRKLNALPLLSFVYAGGLLLWEHLNGGIKSHHFLAREDMPAISNAWGLVVLPLVGWLCAKSLQHRLGKEFPDGNVPTSYVRKLGWAFAAAAVYGAAIVVAFLTGHSEISGFLFPALFVIGLFLPIYRAEYYLGFVAALCPAFGAVLPVVIGGVVAGVSFVFRGWLFPMLKKRRK